MNTQDHNPPDPTLDTFLDDALSPAEQARMRRRIAADPQLQAECERQQAIDASLARLFAAPMPIAPHTQPTSTPQPADAAPRPLIQPRTDRGRRVRLLAKVAIILIGFGYAGWVFADFVLSSSMFRTPAQTRTPYARYSAQYPTTFEAAYGNIVNGGFQPDWVCETDAQFADTFLTQLGQPILFRPDPPATTMAGLSYQWVLSPHTVVMLGTAHGSKALVFVDRAEHDQAFSLPPGSGLNLFRRQIGDLVLYEVTPRDTPALLDGFNLALTACP